MQIGNTVINISLKGASHEIPMGQIWYQMKDLEKLELRGYIFALTATCIREIKRGVS